MALQKHLLVLVLLACLNSFSYAYQFYVGGRAGWVPNPSENYNSWAERMRFQVNDTLVFRYKKGSTSVLVVNKEDYDKCSTANRTKMMDDGNSIFKFDHSGPFYFISGNKDDCEKGQKLIIVVLAIRPSPPSTPTPPTTPSHGPVAAAPKGTTTPISLSPNGTPPVPAPVNQTPASSPVNAPTPATSPASHAPSGNSPTSSPAPANSSGTPSESPAPAKTSPSSAPSGAITSPSPSSSGSSSSPTSSPPATSTAGSISPAASSGNTPADIHSPTGSPPNTKKNSAVKALTTTTTAVLVSTVLTIAFIVCP